MSDEELKKLRTDLDRLLGEKIQATAVVKTVLWIASSAVALSGLLTLLGTMFWGSIVDRAFSRRPAEIVYARSGDLSVDLTSKATPFCIHNSPIQFPETGDMMLTCYVAYNQQTAPAMNLEFLATDEGGKEVARSATVLGRTLPEKVGGTRGMTTVVLPMVFERRSLDSVRGKRGHVVVQVSKRTGEWGRLELENLVITLNTFAEGQ